VRTLVPLKAVALMGATGTGKSSLAMKLALGEGITLISCDSMQVYRKLDIGTAKASRAEQTQVPHALIDCADITETWNAQIWADAAKKIIRQENERGKIPIMVGGTGMYLKALLHGFAEVPAEKEGVRDAYESMQKEHGTVYLHEQLQKVDMVLADRLAKHDTQRIIRGLSVFESTGVSLSSWHDKQMQTQQDAENHLQCPVFVLEMERERLRARIAERFQLMMDMGWLDESKWLNEQELADTHPVMRAVGYRQLLDHLAGDCSLEDAVRDGITATRRYAKRQRTWFKNQTAHAVRGSVDDIQSLITTALRQT